MAAVIPLRPGLDDAAWQRLRTAQRNIIVATGDAIREATDMALLGNVGDWYAALRRARACGDALCAALDAAEVAVALLEGNKP